MTVEPEWLTVADVIDAHARQLRVFGGAAGISDEGALESAIERPINKWRYEAASVAQLATA